VRCAIVGAGLWLGFGLGLGWVAACGDNIEGAFDAAVPIDARQWFDADLVACGADAGCETAPFRPVCDPERGVCAECVEDPDCAGRGDSFGPRCDPGAGTCTCRVSDDCAGNPNGPSCDPIVRACTCLDDGECESPATCELEPYLGALVRTCQMRSAR
jgi:hypothetical protein